MSALCELVKDKERPAAFEHLSGLTDSDATDQLFLQSEDG